MQTNRETALAALQKIGSDVVPALVNQLKSSSVTESCRAALTLGKMGTSAKSAIPDLIHALDNNRSEVQCQVMMALLRLNVTNQDLEPKLISKLNDKRTANYAAALLNAIERERLKMGLETFSDEGFSYGIACLKSPTPSVRLNGAIQLAKIAHKDERAQTAMHSLLSDENAWVKQEVARLIADPTALTKVVLVSE